MWLIYALVRVKTLFTIETREFGWDEIVAAAKLWGDWDRFVDKTREALACFLLASETNALPSVAKIREVTTAFRYARNLISGEETQEWLQHWDMTIENWMDCLKAQSLRQCWAGRLTEIKCMEPISDQELELVIKHHAICSGKLEQWTRKLAGHAAVAANTRQLPPTASAHDLIDFVEAEFDRARRQSMTPKHLATKISDHRLEWIHYDCRYLWFDQERVGREALWCIRDGMTLDEVAVTARDEVKEWSFYADEIDARIRPAFLAARQGDLLGPLKLRAGYPLFSLIRKTMPEVDDPQIISRAETAIVANLTSQAINERVNWMVRFSCQ